MLYRITHHTSYRYQTPVRQGLNTARMLPRDTSRQQCRQASIRVSPAPTTARERTDYFGNRAYHFTMEETHSALEVSAESLVDVSPDMPLPELDLGSSCRSARELLANSVDADVLLAREFVLDSPLVAATPALRDYAAPSFDDDRPLISAVRDLTQRIFADFSYHPGFTDVTTPLDQVLEHRRGVCQDFAHLAVGCVRAMGYPARYISGYLETQPPPGQEKLVGSDETHAWFAVYSPGEGWFEFDPTNDKIAGVQHIIAAWGRDYGDVAPLRGVVYGGGGDQQLSVSVDVRRV